MPKFTVEFNIPGYGRGLSFDEALGLLQETEDSVLDNIEKEGFSIKHDYAHPEDGSFHAIVEANSKKELRNLLKQLDISYISILED